MPDSREFPDTRPSLLAALDDNAAGAGWLEFYHSYAPAVFRVARRRGMSQHDAEDVVQQTMLAISRHIGGFAYDRDRGTFRSWVRRIAESRIVDFARRRHPPAAPISDSNEPVDDRPSFNALWQQEWKLQDLLYCLERCRDEIAPRTFEAFRMYVLEGVSAADTAARTGLTVNHVYVVRSEVLKRLRKLAQSLHDGTDERDSGAPQ